MNRIIAVTVAAAMTALALVAPTAANAATNPGTPPPLSNLAPFKGTMAAKGHPGGISPRTTCTTTCYKYAEVDQFVTSDGGDISAPATAPQIMAGDAHSLFELDAQDGSGDNVEIGYTVDTTGVNGTDHTNPHLFIAAWEGGNFLGYNGGGFVPIASPVFTPGQALTVGTTYQFEIYHTLGGWWLLVNGNYMGEFPDSVWSSHSITFTQSTEMAAWGEVAAAVDPTETDMTNAMLGSAATLVSGYGLFNGSAGASLSLGTVSNSEYWTAQVVSATSARIGGPGGHPDINDCSGVGLQGYGQTCYYTNITGGVPNTKVNTSDGGLAPLTCVTNQGTGDTGGHNIKYVTNTTYKEWQYFKTANCTGTATNIVYGVNTLPTGYSGAAHASFWRTTTGVTHP